MICGVFSFVKNWHFWCKMTQFSVLFMDIFWIHRNAEDFPAVYGRR